LREFRSALKDRPDIAGPAAPLAAKAARALALTVPASSLLRADEVLE